MARLALQSECLTVIGNGTTLELDDLTEAYCRAVLHSDATDPVFAPEAFLRVSPEDRQRFKQACQEHGLSQEWGVAALSWVAFDNADNSWHPEVLDIVYFESVDSWWIDSVAISDTDHRFVQCGGRIMSFAEFAYVYGESVQDHLMQYASVEKARLEGLADVVTSPLVKREVTYQTKDGLIGSRVLTGVSGVPTSSWKLPDGHELVDSSQTLETLPSIHIHKDQS